MLEVYADFAENFMGVPVIKGIKTENEFESETLFKIGYSDSL
jgi:hypothetical protein